jgi:hypothetical protein
MIVFQVRLEQRGSAGQDELTQGKPIIRPGASNLGYYQSYPKVKLKLLPPLVALLYIPI